ncbi:MAG: metallophosphoesterase [Nitrospiraceae bacterium]|nr:metallophosphoesterase [Nitrospiraceae bacterium]
MTIFLSVFLLLYWSMHAYLFCKLRAAFALSRAGTISAVAFLLLMVFAPVFIRYAERAGMETVARATAWTGFLWMGWLLLFCASAFSMDIYRGIIFIAERLTGQGLASMSVSTAIAFLLSSGLALATAAYGFFEARNVRAEHLEVPTTKLPEGIDRVRIAQISDVHLGLIQREPLLRQVAEIVQKENPDMLVSTGDLVDGQICAYNNLSAILAGIRPRYGKFAITGNHEFYAGIKEAKCFIEDAGFTLLRGQRINLGNIMTIAGVDDPAVRQLKLGALVNEKDLLADVPAERFRLLLKHRPSIDKGAIGLFDLQLSGHVHKGQIFPFSILTWLYYPLQSGFADLGGGSSLYVSRGTGTWGPPIRVLSPPEVTIIDIVRRGK